MRLKNSKCSSVKRPDTRGRKKDQGNYFTASKVSTTRKKSVWRERLGEPGGLLGMIDDVGEMRHQSRPELQYWTLTERRGKILSRKQ